MLAAAELLPRDQRRLSVHARSVLPRDRVRLAARARHALVGKSADLLAGGGADRAAVAASGGGSRGRSARCSIRAPPIAALAFGHALLARVRLAPVMPAAVDELDPFVVALRRIEQENGRMIQAQIRLLKDGASPLPVEERTRLIEDEQSVVDGAFGRFLESLC